MKSVMEDIVGIVRACDIAFVSTINLGDFPETRALDNCFNREIDDKLEIYFCCDVDSPKVEQLKKNSRASLYYYVAENMNNMILFGRLELVTDKSLKEKLWKDDLLEYWEDGKEDKKYGVLKFVPTGYKYYSYGAGCSQKNEGKF
jgi:general stress protein 26